MFGHLSRFRAWLSGSISTTPYDIISFTPPCKLIYENKLMRDINNPEKMLYSIQANFTNLFTSFELNKHYETKEQVLTSKLR
jgi:hypothetical protein